MQHKRAFYLGNLLQQLLRRHFGFGRNRAEFFEQQVHFLAGNKQVFVGTGDVQAFNEFSEGNGFAFDVFENNSLVAFLHYVNQAQVDVFL